MPRVPPLATALQLFNFISSFLSVFFGLYDCFAYHIHHTHFLHSYLFSHVVFSLSPSLPLLLRVFFSVFTALLLHLTGILYAFHICISRHRSLALPLPLPGRVPVNYAAVYAVYAHF